VIIDVADEAVKETQKGIGARRSRTERLAVMASALLALFLGALDTLIMGSAMPTVVADLGGLPLYGWVFSAYLLSRAVALPVFGKFSDLFGTRRLFLGSVGVFLAGSAWAGLAPDMGHLIAARTVQGLGSGGNFALVYIVLTEVSEPHLRGKTLSMASIVWGVASVLGPPLGGFIVGFVSWRWIFWMNLPLGALSLGGLYLFLHDTRRRQERRRIDALGIVLLVIAVVALLTAFLRAGEGGGWLSIETIGLFFLSVAAGAGFVHAERRAEEPVLPARYFRVAGFRLANGASFLSSFAIFALAAYSPLFIQGVLAMTPAELGLAMVPLSLSWSFGALICGQQVHRIGRRRAARIGAVLLTVGAGLPLLASAQTPVSLFSGFLALAGLGMGAVSIATLLIVQDSLDPDAIGVATASHQFSRTLGGTIGVGVCGALLTARLSGVLGPAGGTIRGGAGILTQPETGGALTTALDLTMRRMLAHGLDAVFWGAALVAGLSLLACWRLPGRQKDPQEPKGPADEGDLADNGRQAGESG
jgi:EmrB/QacA subfamily drug resistance transporter